MVGDEFPCLYTLVAALAVSGLPSPREGIEEIRFLPFDPVIKRTQITYRLTDSAVKVNPPTVRSYVQQPPVPIPAASTSCDVQRPPPPPSATPYQASTPPARQPLTCNTPPYGLQVTRIKDGDVAQTTKGAPQIIVDMCLPAAKASTDPDDPRAHAIQDIEALALVVRGGVAESFTD